MRYVDGFLLAVPKKNIPAYRRLAQKAGKIWREYGALDYKECVGDDLKVKMGVPFTRLMKTKPSETVVFSYIVYTSRAHRDAVNKKVMKDPRLNEMCDPKNMPFNVKRMCYGGFTVMVDNANVQPIPDGYHTITPALTIRDAARAIEFYKKAFNATVLDRLDGPDGTVMHASLKIGNSLFMLGEENLQMGCPSPLSLKGTPNSLYLYVERVDAAFMQAVSAGAKVEMPVADMFWGDRAGQLTDPFGHRWWVGTHTRDLTPEQIKQGAQQMCAEKA